VKPLAVLLIFACLLSATGVYDLHLRGYLLLAVITALVTTAALARRI
jgi:hypothetical protein